MRPPLLSPPPDVTVHLRSTKSIPCHPVIFVFDPQFPPLQLTVSPIRCASSVGGVATLDEDEIGVRRDKQKARLRRRAREWWKAAGSIDDGERGGTVSSVEVARLFLA